ncbi:uncharacterized protein LOC116856504 [Lontra canadensis]|uniref:uncharacterized protein LOC116856504 n=1 Tax=Lontra canadensis TaxID=76717 RepID=UPI0013F324C0|nr:uncharacterized protein LOC116856504 [Lontra canadensis]
MAVRIATVVIAVGSRAAPTAGERPRHHRAGAPPRAASPPPAAALLGAASPKRRYSGERPRRPAASSRAAVFEWTGMQELRMMPSQIEASTAASRQVSDPRVQWKYESEHSARTGTESGITRRKGRTSDKGRKFQERIRGKRLTDESQDTNNSIKGVDQKQKPGAARERKRRRLWFQRVRPRSGCPRGARDPPRRGQCLPAGISMNIVMIAHNRDTTTFDRLA